MKKNIFIFLMLFRLELFADVYHDSNGEAYVYLDDGSLMSEKALYELMRNSANREPAYETVIDEKTNTLVKIPFKGGKLDVSSEQELECLMPSQNKCDFSFLKKLRVPLVAGTSALIVYSYFFYKLCAGKNNIYKAGCWANFKKNIVLDVFYEIPEEKMLNDLLVAIYQAFYPDEQPDYSNSEPLYIFTKQAQREIGELESFVNLYWYLKLPIVGLVFPDFDEDCLIAREKIERLSYMIDLVKDKMYAMNI